MGLFLASWKRHNLVKTDYTEILEKGLESWIRGANAKQNQFPLEASHEHGQLEAS